VCLEFKSIEVKLSETNEKKNLKSEKEQQQPTKAPFAKKERKNFCFSFSPFFKQFACKHKNDAYSLSLLKIESQKTGLKR
jgi:hypothetical protein